MLEVEKELKYLILIQNVEVANKIHDIRLEIQNEYLKPLSY